MVKVTFVTLEGDRVEASATPGNTLMEAAVGASVEGIPASCGGSCSCSTCHVVLPSDWIKKVGQPEELEKETLEFADGVCETSRLSCQITVTEDMDGMEVRVGG